MAITHILFGATARGAAGGAVPVATRRKVETMRVPAVRVVERLPATLETPPLRRR